MKNNIENEMQSLYDYLGRPARAKLGADVYAVACKLNIYVLTRHVETKTYQGKVMLYPKNFLDLYFKHT